MEFCFVTNPPSSTRNPSSFTKFKHLTSSRCAEHLVQKARVLLICRVVRRSISLLQGLSGKGFQGWSHKLARLVSDRNLK